jgi:hypothetical protein
MAAAKIGVGEWTSVLVGPALDRVRLDPKMISLARP